MSFGTTEPCLQENIHQFKCQRISEDTATDANKVQIVVLNTLSRRKRICYKCRTNTSHLIGGDVCSDPTAANGYSPLDFLFRNGFCQRKNKIGVIIRSIIT